MTPHPSDGVILSATRSLMLRDLWHVYHGSYRAIYEDAASHAIEMALTRGLRSFDERGPAAYCVTCARHYIDNEHRRHGRRRAELDGAEEPRAAGAFDIDDAIDLRDLLARIQGLRPHRRTAAIAQLLGLTYKQTCDATGRSYTWVNKHTTKMHAELRAA